MMDTIRALLVEDDKVDQMAFKRSVKENNLSYLYFIASTIAEAEKYLKFHRFDIVILDYFLGDGTALDIFDLVTDIPIVITTGAGDEETAVKALKAGAYDYLIKDPDLNYLKILPVTVENAIKRKKVENKFNMLSHVVTNIGDCVFITNLKDRIIFVNEAFCKTYGYEKKEVIGKHINVLWKKECRYNDIIRKKIIGNSWKGELYNRRSDGSEFPIYLSRSVIKDDAGNEIAIAAIGHDITERKQAEDERKKLIDDIKEALGKIKTLSGLIPICASCKKVRDDKGYWEQVEAYITKHTEAFFSHGLCPDCAKDMYPQLDPKTFNDVFEDM